MARCSLINRSWLEPAVELRLGKICRRLPQDLVRLAQLTVLTLERLDPLALFGCRTRSRTLVTVGLARCEACSPWWSRTIRTARARTSGEYGGTRFLIAPSSQELEPPTNPVRFSDLGMCAAVGCGHVSGLRCVAL